MFCKKGGLENFARFSGKHPCQSLSFNKVAEFRATTLIKWRRTFFIEYLRTTAFAISWWTISFLHFWNLFCTKRQVPHEDSWLYSINYFDAIISTFFASLHRFNRCQIVTLYILGTIHHMIVIYGTHL